MTAADTRCVFALAERDSALEQLAIDAGPATEAITVKVNQSFEPIRGQLNELAGGQASPRVMMLAHHAQRVEVALELQTAISMHSVGRYIREGGESDKKAGKTEVGLRNLAGIGAFASDLLTKAYQAAEAEGKAKAAKLGPVDELMTTLGVTVPDGGQVSKSASGPDFDPPTPSSSGPSALKSSAPPKQKASHEPATRLSNDPFSPNIFEAELPKKPPRRKSEP